MSLQPVPEEAARCRCGAPIAGQRCTKGHAAPGNELGLRTGISHGVPSRSLRATREACLRELEDVLSESGLGLEPRFAHARALAASALARSRLLQAYIEQRGLFDRHGRLRPQAKLLEEAEASARRWLEALGMVPTSAAKLGLDLGRARQATLAAQLAAMKAGRGRGAQ